MQSLNQSTNDWYSRSLAYGMGRRDCRNIEPQFQVSVHAALATRIEGWTCMHGCARHCSLGLRTGCIWGLCWGVWRRAADCDACIPYGICLQACQLCRSCPDFKNLYDPWIDMTALDLLTSAMHRFRGKCAKCSSMQSEIEYLLSVELLPVGTT